MPIHECTLPSGKKGWQWGEHGKCYPTRAQASRQAQAAYASGYRETKKADRIVRDFTSFDEAAKGILQLISQLHTSRVSGFGFAAEADVRGIERYAINEQLDNRICPVCRAMHGRTFSVDAARRLLDQVVFEEDPELLKTLQPWPSQKAEHVAAMRNMTEEELVLSGWHIPPYHPWCRGLLVGVGDIPDIQTLPSTQQGKGPGPDRLDRGITRADIEALADRHRNLDLHLRGDLDKLAPAWKETFGTISPERVYRALDDAMQGAVSANSARLTLRPNQYRGESRMEMMLIAYDPDGKTIAHMDRTLTKAAPKTVAEAYTLTAHHDFFKIEEQYQNKGLGKSAMRALVSLYEELGVGEIVLNANVSIGAYAWAKYGFLPQSPSSIGNDIWRRLRALTRKGVISKELSAVVERMVVRLVDGDRQALHLIADMAFPVGPQKKKLGLVLLENLDWNAYLELFDPEAMTRFWDYVGRPA